MEHMQSALDRFTAAWQSLSATTLDSGFLTGLINFGTDAITVIDDLVDRFGVLQPLLAGIFGGAGLLGKGLFKTSDNGLSFLNTSLSDLKDAFSTGWNRGKNKNGAVGFLSGASEAFSEFNKNLSKFDRKALDNVRSILSKGEGNFSSSELVAAFDGTSDALSGLKDKAKEGKLSLDDLGNASAKTKTSMLATKAAALALNVGIGLLASVAIDAAIKAFDNFVHAAENASEAADLAFDDASATATQAEESYRSLTDLVSQYKTLAAQDTTDPTVRLQIADVQSQINDLIGDEASGIDLVNGNLSQQLSLLNQIQASQASKTLESAKNAYNAAVEASEKAIGEDSFLGIKGWGLTENWDEDAEEFFNSVDEAYKKGTKNVSRGGILGNTLFIGAEYDNEMHKLETAAEKAEYLQGMVDNVTAKLGKDAESNKIVQGLKQQIEAFTQYTDDISSSARTVMENLAEEFSAKNALSEFTDIGAEQFEAARSKMLSYIKNDTSISKALKSGALDSSDISSYVNTYLSTLDNFSNGYYEWASDIQSVQDMMDVNGIGSLDGLGLDDAEIAKLDSSIEKMHQLKEAYSDFQAGELDTSDIDKLKKDFPELATIMDDAGLSSDDFGLAIQTLLSDMNADTVATFNGAIGDVTKMSDEAKSSVTILGNAIQNLGAVSDAMSFDINLEEETNTLSKLNEAMAASKTATGLTAEQIESINVAFGSLDGYNAAAMFEETANGIRLNTQEYNKFSKALADGKLKEADDALETLNNQYKILTSQINAARKAGDIDLATELMSDRDDIVAQTNAIAEQAAQYKGLTSAYKQWQDAQSAGNDRDMYETIGSAFEEVQDEINRGWWDDSTREYLELMTGRDLSTANIDQMKDAYAQLDKQIGDTGYTIKSFFTQTEDGTFDTNGIYNFLEAAESFEGQLGKDFVKRNEDGNIIGFEIDVEGRKALAEAMGISEELIDIIIRASEDAGFVVNMDGTYTQLADMKAAAEQAAASLKEIGKTQMDFTFDTSDTEKFTAELEEAKKLWESYRNEDGSINFEAEGAPEAVELYSTLVAMADQLSEPTYMQLDASQVDAEIQKPLQMMQDYERLLEKKHQIEIDGGDLTEVNAEMDDIVEKLNGLDKETKVKLGIDGMSKEEIQAGLEAGTIEVPATVDLQIEMSDNIQDIRMALLKLTGAITQEEYDAYIKMRLEPEVDEGDTQQKVQESLASALSSSYSSDVGVSVPVDPEPTKSLQQAFGEENQTAEVDVTPNIDAGTLNEEINDIRATDVPVNLKPAQSLQEALGDNHGLTVDVEPHVTKDVNDILDMSPQEVAVEFIANTVDVDSYTPEEKQAIAKYLVDGGDVESYEAADKDAIVRFLKESGDVDNYTPAQRQAIAKYILDSSQPDGYQPNDKQATAKFNKDSSEPDNYQPSSKSTTVTYKPDTSGLPTSFAPITRTVKYVVQTVGNFIGSLFGVNGTAHASGTAYARGTSGRAFKQGDWSTKKDEVALTGELGPELVVPPNGNRWYTVGDNGAEFAKIPRGSIVFNHKQTEELFKNGRVTSGGGRGRSLANGTAFSTGSGGAGRPGSGGKPVGGGTTVVNNNTTNNYYNGSKSSSKSSSSKSTKSSSTKSSTKKATEEADDFEETLDLIEIMIDRIERAIDSLDRTASSAFVTFTKRSSALNDEISKTREEIDLQQRAYERYMQQAQSVGLSADWQNKIMNGEIDISVITDENLKDQIDDFQEFYEKALDAKDAVDELKESLGELANQRFELVQTQFEGILGSLEYEQSMVENFIDRAEVDGQFVSKNYYKFLQDNVHAQAEALREEVKQLIAARDEAVNNGEIEMGGEQWDEYNNQINDITVSIHELGTQWAEYNKAIRETEWEIFDTIQDRISNINTEAQFLIDLMSNDKLFEDNGQFTDKGLATMGLYAQQYNVLMNQADRYAEEIKKIEEQMGKEEWGTDYYGNATNAFNQDIIDRYYELIEAQQEAILSAEDMKESIRDLVEEGIQLELDNLDDLIEKYLEALHAQEDLYDYEQEISQKTDDIASLRKQMSAYENDTSEETQAKLQKLKDELEDAEKDLADTERQQMVSDIERLLDNLQLDYEEILNMRLDNIDALMMEMIAEANANSALISDTITQEAENVGYTLSDEMQNIWNGEQDVLAYYGDNFLNNMTNISSVLNGISTGIQNMVNKLDSIANQKIQEAQSSNASKIPVTKPSTPSTTPSKPTTTEGDGVPKVGDKVKYVSGKYYLDSYGTAPLGSHNLGGYVYITRINSKGSHPYHISTGNKLGNGDLGWLKLNQISGYAIGKKSIDDDEYAWTQENGKEMIVRPSDGAILTPLAKNDSVLTAGASSNIWSMANNPRDFIKDNLGLDNLSSPAANSGNTTITQNLENVVFSLPNVKNYEELLSSMQKDRNFERLITAMTVDKIAGKNTLTKSKALR